MKPYTEEEENFLRVCLLLFKIGTKAVHRTFDKYLSQIQPKTEDKPYRFREIFHRYRISLDDLKITDSQRDLIFPKDEVNTAKFDISLMTLLLKTLDSKGIIKLEENTANALLVIKKLRNEILGHKVSPKLSNEKLETFWKQITEIIKQLVGDRFERDCYSLRSVTSDTSNTEILDQINEILDILKFEHADENQEANIPTTDEEHFSRLCSLVLQIAPIAVRYCFKKEFSGKLEETFKNLSQVDDIGIDFEWCSENSDDNDKVENCEVSLMLFLFKYVGFRILDDSLPADSDTSTAADLTRINYYTQVLFETKTRLLNSAELDVIWKIVAEATTRLGDVQMKQMCESQKKANIGEKNKNIMLGLAKIAEKIILYREKQEELKERLIELQHVQHPFSKIIKGKNKEVDEWVEQDKSFVETKASALLLDRSLDKHLESITVVGSFGVGKTSTTRHVALILRHEGYRILPVSKLAEIKELDDEDVSTVFIVDDFCGKASVEQRSREIRMWRNMPNNLIGRKSKIIVCCTLMVFQHVSFSKGLSYFRSCVINMNSSDLALNESELHSIAKMHTDIDDRLIEKYSKEFSFFPFLCKCCSIFSTNNINVPKYKCHEAIFKNANEVYTFQLKTFCIKEKAKFTALALIVQLNNFVREGYFTKTSKDYISHSVKINRTLEACKFHTTSALSDIKEELKSMIGPFIIVSTDARNNKIYSAKTPDVYRMLVEYYKEELPEYFNGSFPSHKNYSKFHSVLTYVHSRVNTFIDLTPILFSWLMVAIGIWVVWYAVYIEIKPVISKFARWNK